MLFLLAQKAALQMRHQPMSKLRTDKHANLDLYIATALKVVFCYFEIANIKM